MALTKHKEIGELAILPDGQVRVRQDTIICDDSVEISRTFHSHVIAPGDDLVAEDPWVRKVATAIHTADVVADYQAAVAARRLSIRS